MDNLIIDPEFENYIPPLGETELEILEDSLMENGCIDPIIVWNGIIIDGHNRYRICQKHNISFAVHEITFDSRDKAKLWMARHQLGRRNLKSFQRCELVYPVVPVVKAEVAAKRREAISAYRSGKQITQPGAGSKESRDIIAEMAGVSHTTWQRAVILIEHADEETKQKLRTDELTIGKAYKMYLEETRDDLKDTKWAEVDLVPDKSEGNETQNSLILEGVTTPAPSEPQKEETFNSVPTHREKTKENQHPAKPIPFDVRTPEGEVAYPFGKKPEVVKPYDFKVIEAQFEDIFDYFTVNVRASLEWISKENATPENQKTIESMFHDLCGEVNDEIRTYFEKMQEESK